MELIISFLSDQGYIALFILMALENMNIPIPSEIILGFAGFLVSQHIFSFWPTVIIGTAAGLAGSIASYYIGARSGRAILLKYSKKGGMTYRKLEAANSWFARYGGIAVLTGRLLPGVRTFISLPAGIARYPLSHFIFMTIIGTIPWTIVLVYAGLLLGENWTLLLDYKIEIGIACVILSAILGAALYYGSKKRGK